MAGPDPTPSALRHTPQPKSANFSIERQQDEEHYPSTIDPRILHVKLVLEHLGDLAGKRVADVGCGKGRFARLIQDTVSGCVGLRSDLAEAMLAHVPPGIHRCVGYHDRSAARDRVLRWSLRHGVP